MEPFITSQFNQCSIVWMCNTRNCNNKVNRIHERAVRVVYQDFQSSFTGLHIKDNSFTIHQRNLYFLAMKILKINIFPEIMNEIFHFPKNSAYALRCRSCLARSNIQSTHFGIESIPSICYGIDPKICRIDVWYGIKYGIKDLTKSKTKAHRQFLKAKLKNGFHRVVFKEVRYNCSTHRSAHLFIIAISSHSYIRRKQPQRTFLQYRWSLTMINIVKKHLRRKIHELNTLIGSSNDS